MPENPFDSIPEVDFTPRTVDELLEEMVADYEAEYYRQTGERKSLVPASAERIYLYTEAARFHTAYQLIDRGCKMNLLKYSEGEYLDNLAALFGITRLPPQRSVARAQFQLFAPQSRAVRIPQGTRVTTTDRVYFTTDEEVVIPAGETVGAVNITSVDAGAQTAGISSGSVNTMVDTVAFVSAVESLTATQGGVDTESDDNLRLRIYYFKDSYSVAGPESAYRYFIKSYSQAIEGISIHSPEPGVTDVRITLTGGALPEQPFLDGLQEYLFTDKRPLTDHLTISAPDVVEYAVEATYYIARSNQSRQEDIHKGVEAAVQEYLQWQSQEIGRDISPDMLTKLVMQAGAKRVPVAKPSFTPVDYHSVCRHTTVNVAFGGIEDD